MLILQIAGGIILALVALWLLPFLFMVLMAAVLPLWGWMLRHEWLTLLALGVVLGVVRAYWPAAGLVLTVVIVLLVLLLWMARHRVPKP
jgi:hypothetical protein